MRTIILFSVLLCGLIYPHTKNTDYGKYLQYQQQIYLSMYLPVSEKTDLKNSQITHLDGTPIKFTLTAFNYNPMGTVGGYADVVRGELYIGYRNPDNATPTIEQSVLLHELFHITDGHHNLQKYCKKPLDHECMENKAYDFTHLYDQVKDLEKAGWLKIN